MLKSLLNLVYHTFNCNKHFTVIYKNDIPEDNEIKKNRVYIIGENQHFWYAIMSCPCNCGAIIRLNLLKDTKPCWEFKTHKNKTVSIFPSVWRNIGCHSHFILTKGVVKWVKLKHKKK